MCKHPRCVQFDIFGAVPAEDDPVTCTLPDGPKTIRLEGFAAIRSALKWPDLWVYLREEDLPFYAQYFHFPAGSSHSGFNLVLVPRASVELIIDINAVM